MPNEIELKIGLSDADKASMQAAITALVKASLITVYSSSATYALGDFVYYDGKFYKCTTAISTAEAWNSGHWEEATLNDVIDKVNQAANSVENKVDPDDICPDLRVGYAANADQLNSPDFTTDQTPYLYRTSGGDADIGNREKDTIVGGSLGWNQLIPIFSKSSTTINGITFTNNNDGSWTINGTASDNAEYELGVAYGVSDVAGGRFLVLGVNKNANSSTHYLKLGNYNDVITSDGLGSRTYGPLSVRLVVKSGATVSNEKYAPQFIDLKATFGSEIADYIYSLEVATAGAGVAWFRKYFKKSYYPYKAIGGFLHVKLISHDMVHFNQWNEEWELGAYNDSTGAPTSVSTAICSKSTKPIKVFPNTTYCAKVGNNGMYSYFYYYDEDMNYISHETRITGHATYGTFTTPSNCSYVRFYVAPDYGTTYKGDITINLSWSGWRNGQYEAYKKNSYPLDTSVILRGIPKLDANNNLYYDGDRYEHTGKVTRKRGVYTFTGNETVLVFRTNEESTYSYHYGISIVLPSSVRSNMKWDNVTQNGLIRFSKLFQYKYANENLCAYLGSSDAGNINFINDGATTQEQALQAIAGMTIIYPLATETEETADPFQETQEVDDFGTEEYVVPEQDGVQVPVGHYTEYPENLRDKLRRLPNMPTVSESTTATYAVNYNGQTKKCSFVPINDWLVANGYPVVQDVSDQITDVAGLSYSIKKAYKIGNVATLTIRATNSTGSAISADTTLFTLGEDLKYGSTALLVVALVDGTQTYVRLNVSSGNSNCAVAIPNGSTISVFVSYAVA